MRRNKIDIPTPCIRIVHKTLLCLLWRALLLTTIRILRVRTQFCSTTCTTWPSYRRLRATNRLASTSFRNMFAWIHEIARLSRVNRPLVKFCLERFPVTFRPFMSAAFCFLLGTNLDVFYYSLVFLGQRVCMYSLSSFSPALHILLATAILFLLMLSLLGRLCAEFSNTFFFTLLCPQTYYTSSYRDSCFVCLVKGPLCVEQFISNYFASFLSVQLFMRSLPCRVNGVSAYRRWIFVGRFHEEDWSFTK